jgi:peptide/nickel transport system permease protein
VKLLVRRGIFYLVTAWAAITLNFFLPRALPGNPIQDMITRFHGKLSPHAIYALEKLFGQSNQNLWVQYLGYIKDVLTGNFGISYTYYPTPVIQIIAQSLPWTLVLVTVSTILSFVIGTMLGIYVGWRRGTWTDGLVPITTFLSSVPYFWFALIIVLIFSITLHWLPVSGGYSPETTIGLNLSFLGSAVYHAILPATTIVVASVGGWLLGMRNMMVTTLAEDYVLLAEAKGLSKYRVMFTYAARNAMLPSLASFAMSLGFIVGGSIVTEIVFSYPGIGNILFQAVSDQDYPLIQAIFLIITFAVLIANLLADIAYVALDPRTRQEA